MTMKWLSLLLQALHGKEAVRLTKDSPSKACWNVVHAL